MQNNRFFILYLNNIQNNIATRDLTINSDIELDITLDIELDVKPDIIELDVKPDIIEPDVKPDIIEPDVIELDVKPDVIEPDVIEPPQAKLEELPCTALLCNELVVIEPGEKVLTFSSARLSEKSKDFLDNEPPQAKLEELPCTALLCNEPNVIKTDIIEISSIILQNHINYNFYNLENQTDLLQEHSEEIFYYLKTIDNETILYKRYEYNDIPAELKDLNPLVHDNVASYSVSGIYYFNKYNEKGYLLNLNYINKLWHINGLSIIQKENEINLCINNGIYYILKTINNFESYLVKVELVKQLPNINKHIYKSKNKLYEIDINGTVTQIII
jgi:hypothetical protein